MLELEQLYIHRRAIGMPELGLYWSSTQESSGMAYSYFLQTIWTGEELNGPSVTGKNNTNPKVRAVRFF